MTVGGSAGAARGDGWERPGPGALTRLYGPGELGVAAGSAPALLCTEGVSYDDSRLAATAAVSRTARQPVFPGSRGWPRPGKGS